MKIGTVQARVPRLLQVLIAAATLAASTLGGLAPADAASIQPRDIAITDDEAGRQAARAIDKDGSDDRSTWVQLRWERDREGPDFSTGPAIVETTVWVAKDLASARAIFQEQTARHKEFPEAFDSHEGPYELPISDIGDEVSGLSACVDCNAKDDIFVHHRVAVRRGAVVQTIYLFGSDVTAPQSLATWYATQAVSRVPELAMQVPERVGAEPANAAAPASAPAEASASTESAGGSASGSASPPAASAPPVQARPKDLAVKIGEAGKRAEAKEQKDGADDAGSWYEVRYERGGTGSRFYEGPVTVFNRVFVAKDVETARKVFNEQASQNEKFPEATERVGDKFELKEANEVGQEGKGMSACDRSCNSNKEIYVHKRLVTRHENVVSVVYLWGLSHAEGTSDWHARYFGSLVMQRARGE